MSEKVSAQDFYRCQFCGKTAHPSKWKKDKCPHCGAKYDAILAQEGDD
jgi:rubrerythrin